MSDKPSQHWHSLFAPLKSPTDEERFSHACAAYPIDPAYVRRLAAQSIYGQWEMLDRLTYYGMTAEQAVHPALSSNLFIALRGGGNLAGERSAAEIQAAFNTLLEAGR